MILIKATYVDGTTITATALSDSTVGDVSINASGAAYCYKVDSTNGDKLYKLTNKYTSGGTATYFYKEVKPDIGTMVQYNTGSADVYKTWKAGTPSWQ
jgi:hypothetical protein